MFESLRNRIHTALASVRGSKQLSPKVIDQSLRQVRRALIEADVALPVIQEFTEQVRQKTAEVQAGKNLTAAETVLSIVYEELKKVIGDAGETLNLSGASPNVILVAGLQGSGKTTTVAKLAKYLKEQDKKKVLVASVDVYRPAAVEQLKSLAQSVDSLCFDTDLNDKPESIARAAVSHARKQAVDAVIIDSAGRLHIDDAMMDEIKAIHASISPIETLFVVDAMTGQDAVRSAAAFNDALPLTGIVVTKLDSDARGGALLSARHVTGKPVKFIGTSEHTDGLERFHPERIASRILGMGDVATLIESAKQKADKDKTEKLANKIQKGGRFDLDDYREQMSMTQDMGGLGKLADMLPNMPASVKLPDMSKLEVEAKREIAIINSMTPRERRHPAIIRASRRSRIAKGSGVEPRFVNQLIRKFEKVEKMSRRMSRGGPKALASKMQKLSSRHPMQ